MNKHSFNENWNCNGAAVTLPHDAMIAGTRDPQAACGSAGAFFPGGSYVYEKTFSHPEAEHVVFQFEGVYKDAKVFINGHEAGGAAYGYIPFFVCADEHLVNGENVIRVECAVPNQPDSRRYSGAGIYRPVWLWEGPKESIEPESVRVSTVSIDPAVIRVQSAAPITFEVAGVRGEGNDFELEIADAKLWSDLVPNLYTGTASNGSDSCEITFGIRKVEWNAKDGLLVNGRKTLLRGGCLHHDSGILGSATYDEGEWRRVRMLKEAGFNAIRSSHNLCSRAMLEACDALGVYMMDETRDMWFHHKTLHDYAEKWREHHMDDLAAMVSRDFNHPSVIMYSIGNEVSEPAKPEGIEAIREMVSYLHETDPDRVIFGSETFPQDIAKNWAMVEKYPYLVGDFMWTAWDYLGEAGIGAWAYTPDGKGFNKPYPWLLADTGAFDILGDPTAELFWASAVWGKLDQPAICVQPLGKPMKPAKGAWRGTNGIPSWSWRGCEGEKAVVEVFFDAARVELFLNATRVGKAKVRDSRAKFKVKYAQGTLEAVAYDLGGREIGRSMLASAKKPEPTILPEKDTAAPGEIVYVPIRLADAAGTVESNSDRKLMIDVEGCELLAFGSANPRTEERFDAASYTTYYGNALAVVRMGDGPAATISVTDGVSHASAQIAAK